MDQYKDDLSINLGDASTFSLMRKYFQALHCNTVTHANENPGRVFPCARRARIRVSSPALCYQKLLFTFRKTVPTGLLNVKIQTLANI